MSTHSEEPVRASRKPRPPPYQGPGQRPPEGRPGAAPANAALMAAKMLIRWLRWAAVLGLVYSAWFGLLYYVLQIVGLYSCSLFLFVAAGAKIAPRKRLTTAIVLAAVLVVQSFRGHVLSNQPPGVTSYQLIIAALQQIAL